MAAQTDALTHKFSKIEPLLIRLTEESSASKSPKAIIALLPLKAMVEFDHFEERLKSSRELVAELVS